jgi:hypothetical protein
MPNGWRMTDDVISHHGADHVREASAMPNEWRRSVDVFGDVYTCRHHAVVHRHHAVITDAVAWQALKFEHGADITDTVITEVAARQALKFEHSDYVASDGTTFTGAKGACSHH